MGRGIKNTSRAPSRVRLGVFVNVPRLLDVLGADPDLVLRRSHFRLEQFADPDLKVSYLQLSRLLAESVDATGCDHFGLLVGQSANASHLGVAGFLMRFAPDIGTALRAMMEYFSLHDGGGAPLFSVHPTIAMLGYAIKQPEIMAIEQVHDLVTACACRLMRDLGGPTWRPTEVRISRRRPIDTRPYKHFFESPIIYNADISAVAFPSNVLTQTLKSGDELLFKHLQREAAEMHQIKYFDLPDVLRQHLRVGLLHRDWSAAAMAKALGINERTLHRRLQTEGTTYRQELDSVRRDFSLQLLSSTNMSLAEITESMCYANSSAFTRAFVRWVGIPPSDWRIQNL